LTMASPPRIQPTQASARAINLLEMPPEPISMPMVIKKGTAMRLKELIPLTICCPTIRNSIPCTCRQRIAERATA